MKNLKWTLTKIETHSPGLPDKRWSLKVKKADLSFELCQIRKFVKGEFNLPDSFFPRDKMFIPKKTRTLAMAKKMCEERVFELAKAILEK